MAHRAYNNTPAHRSSMASRLKSSSSGHVRFVEVASGSRSGVHSTYLSDSSSDDNSSDEEEHDIEAALSRRHGEAVEGPAPGAKRVAASEEDDGIGDLYEKAAKKKKARTKQPELTAERLTGLDGLIRIPQEFPALARWPATPSTSSSSGSGGSSKSLAGAASYALSLIEAYKSFCYRLCPNLAFEDTLLKIERLGSKREVKAYLEQMRQTVRNQHVESVLGKDKAQRILQELHDALEQQQQRRNDDVPSGVPSADPASGGRTSGGGMNSGPPVARPSNDDEPEATFDDLTAGSASSGPAAGATAATRPAAVTGIPPTSASRDRDVDNTTTALDDASVASDPPPPVGAVRAVGIRPMASMRKRIIDDDDEEDEFVFGDEQAPRPGAPVAAGPRRHFSAVEDMDDDIVEEENSSKADEAGKVKETDTAPQQLIDNETQSNDPTHLLEEDDSAVEHGDVGGDPVEASVTNAGWSAKAIACSPPQAEKKEESASSTFVQHASPAAAVEREESVAVDASPTAVAAHPPVPLAQKSQDDRDSDDFSDEASPIGEAPTEDGDSDELATIVPSTLTAPTQWGDDEEEDEETSPSPDASPEATSPRRET